MQRLVNDDFETRQGKPKTGNVKRVRDIGEDTYFIVLGMLFSNLNKGILVILPMNFFFVVVTPVVITKLCPLCGVLSLGNHSRSFLY